MENKYAKLSELDGKSFTVEKAWGFSFKKWDEGARRMLIEEKWRQGLREEGFRKIYGLDTSEGKLDVSERQLKDMLEAVYKNGVADIVGKTYRVKKVVGQNNIPTYYFNVDWKAPAPTTKQDTVHEVNDEPIKLDELGW